MSAVLSIHGTTPYVSLFGRPPIMLRDMARGQPALDDETGARASRHVHRIREISLENIVRGAAEDRMRQALSSRTRPAGQLQELKPGDQIEFFRDPPNKEFTGWRGPAPVVSLDRIDDGIIEVRWQGRVIPCRVPDVRRAVAWLVFLVSIYRGEYVDATPWAILVNAVEELRPGSSVLIGFELGIDSRWRMTSATNRQKRVALAILHVASLRPQVTGSNRSQDGQRHARIAPSKRTRMEFGVLVVYWSR